MSDPYRTSAKPFEETPPKPPKLTAAQKRQRDRDLYWAMMATNAAGKTYEQLAEMRKRSDAVLQRLSDNLYVDD